MKVGDSVKTSAGLGKVIEFYKHDNWCLVSIIGIKYRDYQFKISEVIVL